MFTIVPDEKSGFSFSDSSEAWPVAVQVRKTRNPLKIARSGDLLQDSRYKDGFPTFSATDQAPEESENENPDFSSGTMVNIIHKTHIPGAKSDVASEFALR